MLYHVSHKFAGSYGQRLCEFPSWLDLSANLVIPHHTALPCVTFNLLFLPDYVEVVIIYL